MSIYPYGQCTYWADTCEPWVDRYGLLGDAHAWSLSWAMHGGAVGLIPQVHSIVCFQPYIEGAGGVGHVADVVAVHDNGTFDVSEMDFPVAGMVSYRHNLAVMPGVSFLYETNYSPIQELAA